MEKAGGPMDQVSVAVSAEKRLILVTLAGHPKPASIIAMLDEVDALIARDRSLRVLIDETELRPSFVGPGDVGRYVAAWKRSTALRAARLAVFTPNLAMYGLNRMFTSLADAEGRVDVFRDRASALAWLNRPGDEPKQLDRPGA
jgi:hypothetical protein